MVKYLIDIMRFLYSIILAKSLKLLVNLINIKIEIIIYNYILII